MANNDPTVTTVNTLVNINVTANDTDSDGTIDPATVAIVSAPANGAAVPKVDGTVDYTPAVGFSGQDTFTYTVNDNLGAASNAATVTVTVNAANTPPVANNDPAVTTVDTLVNINVTANDTDSDGTIDPATVAIVSAPANGAAVPKVDGTVDYTPAVGFSGQDTFTYTVNDNLGAASNAATVTVTVNAANTPPVANNDPAVTTVDTLVNINVTANDTDSDGTIDPATIAVIAAPANGTAVPKVNGTVDYTPAAGFSGQDTFTYTVNDNLGAISNVATVTVTVNPAGTPAITSPIPGSVLMTSTVTFQWSTGAGVTAYWLGVGTNFTSVSTPPWGDIFGATTGTNTTQQVTEIPINGNPVYVRLWWKIGSSMALYRLYLPDTGRRESGASCQ